jgi:hypothetical protein
MMEWPPEFSLLLGEIASTIANMEASSMPKQKLVTITEEQAEAFVAAVGAVPYSLYGWPVVVWRNGKGIPRPG